MMRMNPGLPLVPRAALGLAVTLLVACSAAEDDAASPIAEQQPADTHGESALAMPRAEREAQGIETATVQRRQLTATISAPGEVRTNAYRSALVTPRMSAQVVTRHARLGDAVEDGQPLVTLSSVQMAEAQGVLIEADREWRRVRQLGRDVLSEARYVAAQVSRQRSYATALAYGMTAAQIDRLLEGGDASRAMGEFELLSPRPGTVIRDEFVVGEIIEPGSVLFEISDESVLWVQAQLSSVDVARVAPGTAARVSRDGTQWLDGTVVQLQHRLDETTRTQGVRIEIDNADDDLHPGDYVDVVLETAATVPRTAVPSEAVLLMQGSPTVFKIEGEEIHAQPVETGAISSGWTEIEAGLGAGDEVVTQGAFLIKALLLRSQMGEGHAH